MSIGSLRDRIILQKRVPGRDSIGQPLDQWETVKEALPANVKFLSGKEYISADRETSQIKASMRIRRRDVDTAWRIIYGGGIYQIIAVLPDGNKFVNLAVEKIK